MIGSPDEDPEWNAVVEELDEWGKRGMTATFWARDDDAIAMTGPLDRLASFAKKFQIEVGLAVIPSRLTEPLCVYLRSGGAPFYPMCHGWRHVNYGSPWRPGEFGPERRFALLVDDAKCAYDEFARRFGAFPVIFVPPFGRILADLVGELQSLGYSGVSLGPTATERRLSRLHSRFSFMGPAWRFVSARPRHYDVHIDPFDWPRNKARSVRSIASEVVGYLRVRRKDLVSASQPIGLLLHHLKFDETTWSVCDGLMATLAKHPAASWPPVRAILKNEDHPQ